MNVRAIGLLSLIAVAPLLVAGCGSDSVDTGVDGSGRVVTEARSVPSFNQVELAGEGRLLLNPDGPAVLEVQTDDNLMPYIDTKVVDGRLIISTRPEIDLHPSNDVTYRARCDVLSDLVLTGSGDIDVTDCGADDLTIRLDGSGTIGVVGVEATSVTADLGGSGTIVAAGQTGELTASVPGSGMFDGTELEAREAEARIPGSGQIIVWATDTLRASIDGSGSVLYRGEPAVTEKVSGSGSVTPLSDG